MTLVATRADARVQYRDAGEGRLVVARRPQVANGTGLVSRVRHMAGGEHSGTKPGGGVVTSRAVAGHSLREGDAVRGRGVIRRPALQCRRRRAEVEGETGLMAGVASRRHEGMLGGAHVGRTE